jgi:hypothetical protein
MNALLEFDEKEFWIQLFSIVARREEKTEDEDLDTHPAPETKEGSGASFYPGEGVLH